jgi:hypothetical protein
VFLLDDAGLTFSSQPLGGPVLFNSQCTLNVGGATGGLVGTIPFLSRMG